MKNFMRSVPGKVFCHFMIIVMMVIMVCSIVSTIIVWEAGYNEYGEAELMGEAVKPYDLYIEAFRFTEANLSDKDIHSIECGLITPTKGSLPADYETAVFSLDEDIDVKVILASSGFEELTAGNYAADGYVIRDYYICINAEDPEKCQVYEDYYRNWAYDTNISKDDMKTYLLRICYRPETYLSRENPIVFQGIHIMYACQRYLIPIAIAALLLGIGYFIVLLCTAGRRPKTEDLTEGPFFPIPFDVLLFGFGVCVFSFFMILFEGLSGEPALIILGFLAAGGIVLLELLLFLCTSFASRVKQHVLWNRLLLYRVVRWFFIGTMFIMKKLFVFLKRILYGIGRMIRGFFRALGTLIRSIPLIYKTILLVIGISVLEVILLRYNAWEPDNLLILWFIEKLILVPVVLYGAIALRRLQKAGNELSKGNYEYEIDTHLMLPVFKEHAKNLTSISEGMNLAVEEKIRSERLKAELITNVSHDIKTPLTSIINYADLISREPSENQKIKEYSEVLLRQSEKLKRLINDLVEASKASTGNLEVKMVPCDAVMFLSQASGEYEEKMAAAGLSLVTSVPDRKVMILSDSRRMWRIFDNLMNNACKYSQPGTRVYISLEVIDRNAVISFKNISRDSLNISADELMERFVRGDSSRNTEGNGLGLSIARSLTELQNGTFDLQIDGDLFKARISFPLI